MELTLDQALQKGVEAHKAGKAQEADQYYTAILKANPKHPDANHNMGVLAVGLGKVEAALPFFKTALEANPNIAQYWLSYIDALIKLERMVDAKVVFDQAKSNGIKSESFGKLEEWLLYSNQSVTAAQAPTQMQSLINLYNQGQLQQALKLCEQFLLQYPHSATLFYVKGAIFHALRQLDLSIEAYTKALSIKPEYAEANNNMGVTLLEQRKLDGAIEAFNKALSTKPDYAEAYYNLGNAIKEQGRLEEAISLYSKALSIKPDYAEAYNNMGIALKAQGKLEEAIAAYTKTLSLRPDYGNAKHMLSALTGNKNETAPREYVENLFDGYSKKFEASLVDNLEYKIPKLIKDILIKPNSDERLGSVLDLGCGTGLLGPEIRNHCSNLVGIDLSSKMLEVAKQKNVYDKLSHSDIVEYLSSRVLDFDYYIALDVFIYVGDLFELFRLIKSKNKKPGRLVFSTEHTAVDGYHILKSGRYSHSKSYIESLCKKFGYKISHFSTTKLRKEENSFLISGIYILEFDNEI